MNEFRGQNIHCKRLQLQEMAVIQQRMAATSKKKADQAVHIISREIDEPNMLFAQQMTKKTLQSERWRCINVISHKIKYISLQSTSHGET